MNDTEETTDLERALAAVDADSAGHWPTVAGILAEAYRSMEKQRNQTYTLWLETDKNLKIKERELTDSRGEISYAEHLLSKTGIPRYFEDGNDCDDLSFRERVSCLCESYARLKEATP